MMMVKKNHNNNSINNDNDNYLIGEQGNKYNILSNAYKELIIEKEILQCPYWLHLYGILRLEQTRTIQNLLKISRENWKVKKT